jgi:ClpP class serine protease
MQDIADKMFSIFKDVVTKGRQGKLKKPLSEIANGKIFTATDAQALGLIDAIGYQNDAYNYAAQAAGLSRKMVVRYRTPETIFDALTSSRPPVAPPSASGGGGSVVINGINVNMKELHELLTPRMMYLWRGN